jgi:hypothetical protein
MGNFMGELPQNDSISTKFQNWILTIFIAVASVFGIILALICIYALPDRSVKPMVGSIFFASAALIIWGLLYYFYKREKFYILQRSKENEFSKTQTVYIENISDKILKWVVTLFSILFVLWSFSSALICIYALPDKTVQPIAGTVYFFSGALVLSILIVATLKNWSSRKT